MFNALIELSYHSGWPLVPPPGKKASAFAKNHLDVCNALTVLLFQHPYALHMARDMGMDDLTLHDRWSTKDLECVIVFV